MPQRSPWFQPLFCCRGWSWLIIICGKEQMQIQDCLYPMFVHVPIIRVIEHKRYEQYTVENTVAQYGTANSTLTSLSRHLIPMLFTCAMTTLNIKHRTSACLSYSCYPLRSFPCRSKVGALRLYLLVLTPLHVRWDFHTPSHPYAYKYCFFLEAQMALSSRRVNIDSLL